MKRLVTLLLFVLGMISTSFVMSSCVNPATADPDPALQSAIDGGYQFLIHQFNASEYLFRESQIVEPDRMWLATDNLLATYALDEIGVPDMADRVREGLDRYGFERHGLIEALVGETVDWPPRTEDQVQVSGFVWSESRIPGSPYLDWKDYADLAFYGALVAHNAGDEPLAASLYHEALSTFDGVGFPDVAYRLRDDVKLYATYKLALSLIVGSAIGEPPTPAILSALLDKQETESGGFITLYDSEGIPQGDANTESTAYALLAIARLR